MTRSEGRWRLDALRERTVVPLSWVATVVAHLLLGLLVGIVAVVGTALGAAGARSARLSCPSSCSPASETRPGTGTCRRSRGTGGTAGTPPCGQVGLTIAAVWGVVVVAVLVGLAGQVLVASPHVALVEDVRDDLLPVLALAVAFSVLPALVFRWDLRALGSRQPDER